MKPEPSAIRIAWKIHWRQSRIIHRETVKQMCDATLYGTGYVEVGPDVLDFIRHIPLEDVVYIPA